MFVMDIVDVQHTVQMFLAEYKKLPNYLDYCLWCSGLYSIFNLKPF